jgi:peptidoglycan biosynthesis protein MviN/MurJ (putative lipid II flippase)
MQGRTLLVAFLLTIASVAAVKIVLTVYYDKIEAKSPMDF